jgi:DNA-binding CsgD family transcriptional regulator
VGVNGASSAALMLGWGYYLCSVDSRHSAFGLTLAFAVYGAATWGMPHLPDQLIAILTVLFPLLSLYCWSLSISSTEASSRPDAAKTPRQSASVMPWGIISLLFICTIASILAKLLTYRGPASPESPYNLFWPAIFVLIFILYAFWMIALKRSDQDMLWPVFVLVIFSGLLCYCSFVSIQPGFASEFFRATSECLMLFCWVITASVVHRNQLPRIFFFALSVLFFVVPPTIVSASLTLIFPGVSAAGDSILPVAVTAVLAFALMLATAMALSANALSGAIGRRKAEHSDAALPSDVAIIAELGKRHSLTNREREIAGYLVKGYTFPQIAETLVISLDTVRSHVKGIYRKMGIHKKQQLTAMVDAKRRQT